MSDIIAKEVKAESVAPRANETGHATNGSVPPTAAHAPAATTAPAAAAAPAPAAPRTAAEAKALKEAMQMAACKDAATEIDAVCKRHGVVYVQSAPLVRVGPGGNIQVTNGPIDLRPNPEAW